MGIPPPPGAVRRNAGQPLRKLGPAKECADQESARVALDGGVGNFCSVSQSKAGEVVDGSTDGISNSVSEVGDNPRLGAFKRTLTVIHADRRL